MQAKQYPYVNEDGRTVWACCESDIGQPCEHVEPLQCLDGYHNDCEGPVEYRTPLSATGKSFPRCDKHWSERLDTQERINRDYPDSPIPPAWFDPSYAGETWDEE